MAAPSHNVVSTLINVLFLLLVNLVTAQPSGHGHKVMHSHHYHTSRSVFGRGNNNSASFVAETIGIQSASPRSDVTRSISLASDLPTAIAVSSSVCTTNNDKNATVGNLTYKGLCDLDFPGQDIFPFILARSFEECIASCDHYNTVRKGVGSGCLGVVFVPGRISSSDDCYRKYSLNNATSASVPMIAAVMPSTTVNHAQTLQPTFSGVPGNTTTTTTTTPKATVATTNTAAGLSLQANESLSLSITAGASTGPSTTIQVTYASAKAIVKPVIDSVILLGPSNFHPSSTFVNLTSSASDQSHEPLSSTKFNTDLTTHSNLASDTGTLNSSEALNSPLALLSVTPHLSRDGGKGGYLNGQHVFMFCDTASFTTTTSTHNGEFVGFVSSSVAIDVNMKGLYGQPLTLKDGIGEWSDDVGRLRGFAPLTIGEETFNKKMSENGHRLAIWPESSLIPLKGNNAVLFANLIYDTTDIRTQVLNLTYIGNTLLTITAGDAFGPSAERVAKRLFEEDEVAWGSLGGARSWGSSGIGGADGFVYLFGKVEQGILVARCNPSSLAQRSSYQYWTGATWSSNMLSKTSTAFLVNTPIMDFDLFYSPRHLTFIMVYMTIYVDNTFYYRFLNSSFPIIPPYGPGSDKSSDFVENIVRQPWSPEQVLYRVPKPAQSYAYAGSVHQGYFSTDDITNGGAKMLLSWTAKTGLNAASPASGYSINTALVVFD